MQLVKILEVSLVSYLIGSIPTGYIAGRLCGKDLRQEGSGNIGATNVVRVLGKKWGYPVFVVDFLKGALAIVLAWTFFNEASESQRELVGLIAAVAAILGHNFPIWLNFKGGKGVATTAGVILTLFPWQVFLIALVGWNIVFFTTRFVSLASLVTAVLIPIICFILFWFGKIGPIFLWTGFGICALIIWRHRSNLSRLMAGTESRFSKGAKEKNLSHPPKMSS